MLKRLKSLCLVMAMLFSISVFNINSQASEALDLSKADFNIQLSDEVSYAARTPNGSRIDGKSYQRI